MQITKSKLKQIIKEEYNRVREMQGYSNSYGGEHADHETQAASDPEMDQVKDITLDVAEKGGQLLQVAVALKDQGFDASLTMGVLVIDNKYLLGTADKFEIGPKDKVEKVGPYVIGRMG